MPNQYIVHADLDAFYASVEQLDNPELQGKCVLVGGHLASRGVVAACSYEARKYGIHSAMPMTMAMRLCPDAIVIPPRFSRYREMSDKVINVLQTFTSLVEPISADEAFLDVTHLVTRGIPLTTIGEKIKDQVKFETGLTISVGIANSKSVAKIASGLNKPDGLLVVEPGKEISFLAPLPVERLWGIGPRNSKRLADVGITTLGQLAGKPDTWGTRQLGKQGPGLIALSRGIDPRPVVTERHAKSVSAETTFPEDVGDPATLSVELSKLSIRVAMRMDQAGVRGRTITLKLRLANFETFSRSETSASLFSHVIVIHNTVQRLLAKELHPERKFRLLGISVSNFIDQGQLRLLTE